jgi:transcriptional regulator with XRE-family HTH domain
MSDHKISPFGVKLKVLREAAGLTQGQLAEQAGMHKFGIAKLEQGTREPSWDTVQALAKALGTNCLAFAEEADGQAAGAAKVSARGRPRKPDASAGKTVASENTELANVTAGKAKVSKGKKGKGAK